MKKKILITGCSHVSGHGFEDNVAGTALRSKYAWPAMVARDFDTEVYNYSLPGASPDYCIENVQTFEDKQSLSAILVMLPHSPRSLQQLVRNGSTEDQFFHHGYLAKDDRWNKIMAAYHKVCHNSRRDNINFLAYAGYLNHVSTTYNIPLWLTSSTKSDYDLLIENNFQLNSPTDWMTYCREKEFPRLPDGHFGHEAHADFYEKFVKKWLTKNLG